MEILQQHLLRYRALPIVRRSFGCRNAHRFGGNDGSRRAGRLGAGWNWKIWDRLVFGERRQCALAPDHRIAEAERSRAACAEIARLRCDSRHDCEQRREDRNGSNHRY